MNLKPKHYLWITVASITVFAWLFNCTSIWFGAGILIALVTCALVQLYKYVIRELDEFDTDMKNHKLK